MSFLRKESWSPYLGGAVIGLLSWAAFLLSAPLGASTSYVRTAGFIEMIFSREHVSALPYFANEAPMIDWQMLFVLGVLVGAFIAGTLRAGAKPRFVPQMWEERFGPGKLKRWAFAFTGGVIIMFGARMADG